MLQRNTERYLPESTTAYVQFESIRQRSDHDHDLRLTFDVTPCDLLSDMFQFRCGFNDIKHIIMSHTLHLVTTVDLEFGKL
jgi:hypothetical protein